VSQQRTISKWASLACALLLACDPRSTPNGQGADSQTNWLRACEIDSDCKPQSSDASSSVVLSCVCGVCSRACQTNDACGEPGISCVQSDKAGPLAQCVGAQPTGVGLCMPECSQENACKEGQICSAGVCTPLAAPGPEVSVDISQSHQTLVGFGASIAYSDAQIADHPQRARLLDAVFQDLGLDVLRLRNRYVDSTDVSKTGELITASTASLGHAPVLFLTSWTPPLRLKANALLACKGNAGCTLAKTADGSFDYAGFAQYWRDSLDAYAMVGVKPDYIGIQNNPNWMPDEGAVFEACKFLPVEGSAIASIGGKDTSVDYPGLAEAQKAVIDALVGLSPRPKLLAPETSGSANIVDYVGALDLANVDAYAHHLYGSDPTESDPGGLAAGLETLPSEARRPVFITEMEADGFGTALSLHHATVDADAAVFLQNALTSPPTGPGTNPQALFDVDDTTFAPQDPYHAIRHFAHSTAPGWIRVDATSRLADLLVSAWASPNKDALTVILINAGSSELSFKLGLPQLAGTSEITRSVFGDVERSASLGQLTADRVLQLPARSVMTVAIEAP
jgi:O-glycosyl hydrolase